MHDSYIQWLDDGCPKVYCSCPCHGEIIITKLHKYHGIPKYFNGHQGRIYPIPESYQKWLEDGCPKIYCECGCSGEIIIKKYHKSDGIPKYIRGHCPPSEETKEKIREANLGKRHTEETKQKLRKPKSEEHKQKNREAHLGKHPSEETKQKMREANSGKNNGMYGKQHTKETKEKITEKRLGKCSSDKNPNWKGGISFEPYCEKWTEKKREEVREQYGRKCYLCGKEERNNITKTGKIRKLSVHHVDEDKKQGCNGKPWKLVPLCMKCHNNKRVRKLNNVHQ